MILKILGSSSHGNCYILENDTEALIIEAGVKFSKVKQALDFNMAKVSGMLISHEHGDHAKFVNEALFLRIKTYMSAGTLDNLNINQQLLPLIAEAGKAFNVGSFKVIPFDVIHDCAEPFGFFINHKETGNILFITDSMYSKYRFEGVNNMIIEANYCEDIIQENMRSGKLNSKIGARSMNSHMSFQQTTKLLQENDLSGVNNIVLCHLSDGNSDEKKFKEETEAWTLKEVTIADKGVEIPFSKYPF